MWMKIEERFDRLEKKLDALATGLRRQGWLAEKDVSVFEEESVDGESETE
jgi:hypothetical protein